MIMICMLQGPVLLCSETDIFCHFIMSSFVNVMPRKYCFDQAFLSINKLRFTSLREETRQKYLTNLPAGIPNDKFTSPAHNESNKQQHKPHTHLCQKATSGIFSPRVNDVIMTNADTMYFSLRHFGNR